MACLSPRREAAIDAAARFRAMGYNPLPSRADRKQPTLPRYTEARDNGLSDRQFQLWDGDNVQLALGSRWGLVVVDMDGPGAVAVWDAWSRRFGEPPTWSVTNHNPDGSVRGRHLYFSVDPDAGPVPSRTLWGVFDPAANGGRGAFAKRWQVELKGDRSLIVAPPSVHPGTGLPYAWDFLFGPDDIDRPAPLPEWVPALPDPRPRVAPAPAPALSTVDSTAPPPPAVYDRRDVLAAIPDKVALAASWGLRVSGSGSPRASGWVRCHAAGRADRNPSASVSPATGAYSEADNPPVSLFDLACLLGAYPTWRHAVHDLGRRYGARKNPGFSGIYAAAPLKRPAPSV